MMTGATYDRSSGDDPDVVRPMVNARSSTFLPGSAGHPPAAVSARIPQGEEAIDLRPLLWPVEPRAREQIGPIWAPDWRLAGRFLVLKSGVLVSGAQREKRWAAVMC